MEELGVIGKGAGKGRALTLTEPLPEENQIPIVGTVAAGTPILAEECIEDYLTFDTGGHDDEYFALRVRGESMLGVGILPDDLVVVHRQNLAQNGQIVVALLGDEATVKTLKRKGSEVWLMPANPDYQHRRPRVHDLGPRRRRGAAVLSEKSKRSSRMRRSVFLLLWGKAQG